MFNLSDKFLKDYLPTTIELGRSFVTLEYQSTRADSKGLFALDNLWEMCIRDRHHDKEQQSGLAAEEVCGQNVASYDVLQ